MLSSEEIDRSLAVTGERIEREGNKRTRRSGVGIKTWGNVDLASEVTTAAGKISMPVSVAVVSQTLRDLLNLIHENDFMPIVVVDDSDRFLQLVKKQPDGTKDLFAPFVTKVMPWLAEFDCAKVVAVHPTYLERGEWVAARKDGLVGTEIELPTLDHEEQLAAILVRRLEAFDVPAELKDVLEGEALSELFNSYVVQDAPTIRLSLTVAHAAVVLALDQRAEAVSRLHIASALADLG
jgi:hypothetical protein